MLEILRKLEDEDVEAILEEVALPASCDVATLKEDINELVALESKSPTVRHRNHRNR